MNVETAARMVSLVSWLESTSHQPDNGPSLEIVENTGFKSGWDGVRNRWVVTKSDFETVATYVVNRRDLVIDDTSPIRQLAGLVEELRAYTEHVVNTCNDPLYRERLDKVLNHDGGPEGRIAAQAAKWEQASEAMKRNNAGFLERMVELERVAKEDRAVKAVGGDQTLRGILRRLKFWFLHKIGR